MTRVLVTGATGFIGQQVGKALRGHPARALVRGPDPGARLAALGLAHLEPCPGDLLEPSALASALEGCEAVIHLAALVAPERVVDEVAVEQVNHGAAVELARRAREAGCARFVFVSSIAAMGFAAGVATPASVCRPTTAYGRAKREAELEILGLGQPGFRPVILRPPTVYGPGERYNFLSLTRAIARGVFRLIGDGANVMPLATTANVARACVAAAEGRVPAGVHLVADAAAYPLRRVHAALVAALGVRRPRLHLPRRLALVAGAVNEVLHRAGVPLMLSRARVHTLTVDQPFDVSSLIAAGVALDAPLEQAVVETVAEYRAAGVL